MNDILNEVLDRMDPEVVLEALKGLRGAKTPESDMATEKVAKALEKSGVSCGPQGCRSGFVQRQLLNYAGESMIRELHQKISQKPGGV